MNMHAAESETKVNYKMDRDTLRVSSFIRGYHAYMDDWEPKLDEEYPLKREPDNKKDENAVAIVRKKQVNNIADLEDIMSRVDVLGHAPKLMALWLTKFLKRQTNSAKVIINGKRVNRGSGYGLEIPCEYHFHGDRFSCQWLKGKLIQEKFKLLE